MTTLFATSLPPDLPRLARDVQGFPRESRLARVYDREIMTSPDNTEAEDDKTLRELASLTPTQLAAEIRNDAAEVQLRAQAWRHSTQWRSDKHDLKAIDTIAGVIAELAGLPNPHTHHDVMRYVNAVGPILNRWWADRPGPQRDLAQAVDRLRRTAMHRVGWASDARHILGYE